MNYEKYTILIWSVLLACVTGCSSPQQKDQKVHQGSGSQINIQIVAETLQTYQVGKTTIADFIRDAKLINVTYPDMINPSYLNSQSHPIPMEIERMMKSSYIVPTTSPWKIYEKGFNRKSEFGVTTSTWKYVVGDINKPISILSFDRQGKLISISPVP